MSIPIRILLLEDSAADAQLMVHELHQAKLNLEWARVETEPDYLAQLDLAPDVILADYNLPQFDAIQALRLVQRRELDIPFIVVSGAIGEEVAVECMKEGAVDYLLKDRLTRLGPAVMQAMAQKRLRAEKKKLEEQFRQAQKMEAVGRLAGGVAHDFNNLLTIITGYGHVLLGNLGQDDAAHDPLQEIVKAGERAAVLTRQLLAFSRQQILAPVVLDLNALVTDVEKMLRRLIGEDIELVSVHDQALGRVKADPGQIEQVIMNLAVNARDAMPQGGRLALETHNVEMDQSYRRTHPEVRPGAYVMLVVRDTGCGMDQAIKAHIFEPFFTTKEVGKGTGLGLAMAYGIVKQSGGYIYVESEPGRGATFKIYLPRVEEAVPEKFTGLGLAAQPRGMETILLVEDEEGVRRLIRLLLNMSGYTVLEAHNGLKALSLCEQHSGPIHLLVTDVVMPQMGGVKLAERLTALRPDLKVLFLSGYTDNEVVRQGTLRRGQSFLHKPFASADLAHKVRDLLDGLE